MCTKAVHSLAVIHTTILYLYYQARRSLGVCLFDLILYVPSTIFQLNRDGSSCVELVLS